MLFDGHFLEPFAIMSTSRLVGKDGICPLCLYTPSRFLNNASFVKNKKKETVSRWEETCRSHNSENNRPLENPAKTSSCETILCNHLTSQQICLSIPNAVTLAHISTRIRTRFICTNGTVYAKEIKASRDKHHLTLVFAGIKLSVF